MAKTNWLHAGLLAAAVTASLAACAPMQGRETTGQYVDDATITTKVKSAIAQDASFKTATQVHVETMQQTVQLSGFVDNADQKAKAAQLARGINGVRDVKNDIVIR
jgi:hyperosmotically inducible protein